MNNIPGQMSCEQLACEGDDGIPHPRQYMIVRLCVHGDSESLQLVECHKQYHTQTMVNLLSISNKYTTNEKQLSDVLLSLALSNKYFFVVLYRHLMGRIYTKKFDQELRITFAINMVIILIYSVYVNLNMSASISVGI